RPLLKETDRQCRSYGKRHSVMSPGAAPPPERYCAPDADPLLHAPIPAVQVLQHRPPLDLQQFIDSLVRQPQHLSQLLRREAAPLLGVALDLHVSPRCGADDVQIRLRTAVERVVEVE